MASISFAKRHGTWRLAEYLGRTPEGKVRARTWTFATEAEARAAAAAKGLPVSTRTHKRRTRGRVIEHLAENTATLGDGAHRVAYAVLVGDIPSGLVIDHLCRVRHCVRPDHLEPVTFRENLMRSPIAPAAINAAKTHCPQGHEYTPGNTYVQRGKGFTGRLCRTCQLSRNQEVSA